MKTFLKFTVLSAGLLMFAGGLVSCNENEKGSYEDKEYEEVFTQLFFVFSINQENEEFSKDEQCGYLLFGNRGSAGHFHNIFVWAKNLPKKYQTNLLPVVVTFSYTGEVCGPFPVINIVKIQKQ